jgi:hypothetical protein
VKTFQEETNMSTMREHLSSFHKEMARHHSAVADHFDTLAKCMGKASLPIKDATSAIDALSAEHRAISEYHDTAAGACEKAAADELTKGDQVVPSRISGIAPERPTITAVPRAGARPLPAAAGMHPAFAKLIEPIDEEESMQAINR